jgi:hypothetical protein
MDEKKSLRDQRIKPKAKKKIKKYKLSNRVKRKPQHRDEYKIQYYDAYKLDELYYNDLDYKHLVYKKADLKRDLNE